MNREQFAMGRIQTPRVAFTLNNFTERELQDVVSRVQEDDVRYAVIGEETGESGTRHLQGYIALNSKDRKGIKWWKEQGGLKRAHFEAARGSDLQNYEYCAAEGKHADKQTHGHVSFGEPSGTEDSIWKKMYEDLSEVDTFDEWCAMYPESAFKYQHQARAMFERIPRAVEFRVPAELRDWQQQCVKRLERQSERSILFVVDRKGGRGKSALCRWLIKHFDAWACQGMCG